MNIIRSLFSAVVLLVFSTSAFAVLMGVAGSVDDKIAQTTLGSSGEAVEEAWIESVLGFDITYTQLTTGGGANWEPVSDGAAGDYAFDFGSGVEPDHFLVKLGGGGGAGADNSHFLYDNLLTMQWAYVNLADFGSGVSLMNVGVISHVGTSDGGGSVPEPGTLLLMALGILGLGYSARRNPKA